MFGVKMAHTLCGPFRGTVWSLAGGAEPGERALLIPAHQKFA